MLRAQKGIDGVAAFLIRRGGDDAARLVEYEINLSGGFELLSVDFDAVLAQSDGRFRILAHHSIQANFPRANEFCGLSSGTNAKLGKRSRQARFCWCEIVQSRIHRGAQLLLRVY